MICNNLSASHRKAIHRICFAVLFTVVITLNLSLHAFGQSGTGGIEYATSYSGSDIGAQVNNAIAALPNGCGEVVIPAGTYKQTTTIIKPRCIKLDGEGSFGTTLDWQSTSGQAIVAADTTAGQYAYPEGEIADITLSGPGLSSSAIGVYIGGDPHGTIISSTAYGDHQNFNRVRILNFGVGIQWGDNAWSNTIFESLISSEGVGLYFPPGLTNSGESINVINSRTQNSTIALNLVGFSDFYFVGSSCDYNTTCGYVNAAHFYGEHFEQSSGTILTISGTSQPHVEIFGGWAQLSSSSGSDTQMFYVNSTLNPAFILHGTFLSAGHPLTQVINWNGSGGAAVLAVEDLPYYAPGGNIAALTNTPCNFWGCHIDDGQGTLALNGRNAQIATNGSANFSSLTTQNGAGASIGNVGGFGSITGNGTGLSLLPTPTGAPIYLTNGSINAYGSEINASGFSVNSAAGFTGTKNAGACTFTISGGIITAVTGC